MHYSKLNQMVTPIAVAVPDVVSLLEQVTHLLVCSYLSGKRFFLFVLNTC